jgi:hypothetical protein
VLVTPIHALDQLALITIVQQCRHFIGGEVPPASGQATVGRLYLIGVHDALVIILDKQVIDSLFALKQMFSFHAEKSSVKIVSGHHRSQQYALLV